MVTTWMLKVMNVYLHFWGKDENLRKYFQYFRFQPFSFLMFEM